MKVMGAGLDNGLLHVDVVREVPEAAKLRTIKIGTTVETAQPQADPDAVSIANRSLPYGPADHATQRSSIGGYGGAEPYCKPDVSATLQADMEPSL
jgi:hypothetical protein